MPNRIIKESIRTSDTLTLVSAEAERLFWRLVVSVDDYGRFDGRTNIVIGQCLSSFLGQVSTEQVEGWLEELERAGLLQLYEVEGRRYLELTKWSKHQRTRAKDSKFPSPDDVRNHSQTFDSKRSQTQTNVVPNVNENENVNEIVNVNGNEDENENDDALGQTEVAATDETHESSGNDLSSSSFDPELAQLGRVYQEEGFGPITHTVAERLTMLCDEFGFEWVIGAIKEAVIQNRRNLRYVDGILQNWRNEGGMRITMEVKSGGSNQRAGPSNRISGRKVRSITGGKVGRV